MAVTIELRHRLDPLVLPGKVTSRQLANLLAGASANGQRFFLYEESPGEENPTVFNVEEIQVIRGYESDAVGASY